MKVETRAVFLTAVVIGFLGYLAAQLLVGSGNSFPTPATSISLTLFVVAVAGYLASVPIARYTKARERGENKAPPSPFYAVRVLALAGALKLTGSAFAGWGIGLLLWLLVASVPTGNMIPTLALAICGAVLVVSGYLAELNCKAPKDLDGGEK